MERDDAICSVSRRSEFRCAAGAVEGAEDEPVTQAGPCPLLRPESGVGGVSSLSPGLGRVPSLEPWQTEGEAVQPPALTTYSIPGQEHHLWKAERANPGVS